MKYHCIVKNKHTGQFDALITLVPLEIGSIIKWGADDNSPDGLAAWIVIDCSATKNFSED